MRAKAGFDSQAESERATSTFSFAILSLTNSMLSKNDCGSGHINLIGKFARSKFNCLIAVIVGENLY